MFFFGVSIEGGKPSSRFYFHSDIIKMAATVEDWENRVWAKVAGATQNYEVFKTQTKAEVSAIIQNGKDCLAWSLDKARLKAMDDRRVTAERTRVYVFHL